MRATVVLLGAVAASIVAGCGGGSKSTPPSHSAPGSHSALPSQSGRASIAVSSDFKPGAFIPRVHTCDGKDTSPPLRIAGLPRATKEVVVVMRDPDAPGGDFMHWGIAHIAPTPGSGSLSVPAADHPAGAVLGRNSFGSLGYRGPCPPQGSAPHHYRITVYALGRPSGLPTGFTADAVAAVPALATKTLTGLYGRR